MAIIEFTPDEGDDIIPGIIYFVGGIVSGFFYVPESGWFIGIIKSFFWIFILMWQGLVWLWHFIF